MKFMSISEFNEKFNTEIAPNSALEESIRKARIEIGPNDVLVQSFEFEEELEEEDYEEQSEEEDFEEEDYEEQSEQSEQSEEDEPLVQEEEEPLVQRFPEKINMDDLLQEVEDEYDNACDDCGKSHDKTCTHKEAKDKNITDARTLTHLVGFQGKKIQLMKGKDRYMKSLRAYADGDQSAEVRLFDGNKILVSELKPKLTSLKELFASFPAGPHTVQCD